MSVPSAELTTEKLYNQPWSCTPIVGYGAGIYVGTGVEGKIYSQSGHQ